MAADVEASWRSPFTNTRRALKVACYAQGKDPSGDGVSLWLREATGKQASELTLRPDAQSCEVLQAPDGSRRDRDPIACARRRWFR
jgi:hypothetical protein